MLASLLKQPRISAGDSQQVEELLANVQMELARRYADRRDNERALEINRRVFDGKSGKIDAHERAGLLLTIARNQERLGFTSLAEQTMEHVVDLLQKIPCWTQADYRTFQASITERCCIAAKFGNPRTAIRFLEEKHLQFAKTSITIDCYLLARLAIVSTWGPVPDNDIGLHCLPSCRALYDAMPVPSNEETEFRSAVRWLMADMEHCFQNYGREEKIAEQLFIDYKPEQSLERVDVYCRLALVSADRGDLRNEVRYLEKAAAQPAASKDKIVRINWAMADVLGEQGHFNKARSYLQQLKEELAEKQKTKKERDWCLLNLALAHENLLAGESKFEDAYRILLKSLDILEACEKRSNEVLSSNLLGLFYARLAFAAQRVGQSGQPYLELCLKKLRDPKNIKLWGANECRYQTGICLFRQAKFYRGRNQDRTALPLLREAVAYPSHEVCILVLAEVEAALGNDKLAASYYSDALAHLNKTGDTNSVNRFVRGLTYVSYACWLHDRGDQKGADDYADRGLALLPEHRCRQSSDRDILLVDLKRMSKWHHSSTDKLKSLIALIEARRGF